MKVSKEILFNILVVLSLWIMELLGKLILNKAPLSEFKLSVSLFTITVILVSLLIYFLNYVIFIPKFIIPKKYLSYLISFIGMCLIFALLRFFLEEIVVFNITGRHNYFYETVDWNFIKNYMFDSFYYTLRLCILSGIIALVFRLGDSRKRIHQLEIENANAQLSMLRSQISPHFLFNTLNGFYSDLYDEKPEAAKDILKLSQLLRYVTYEVKQNFMPLNKEIEFIKDYLYFYKKRYEDDFYINLTIDGNVGSQSVPSLILVHFIENVCKHGLINDAIKPASISIIIDDNTLEVITENFINSSEKYMDKGIGTANVKKRLEVLFQDDFMLDNSFNGSEFKSYLKMPI